MTRLPALALAKNIEDEREAGWFVAWVSDVFEEGDDPDDHYRVAVHDRHNGFSFLVSSPKQWEEIRKGRLDAKGAPVVLEGMELDGVPDSPIGEKILVQVPGDFRCPDGYEEFGVVFGAGADSISEYRDVRVDGVGNFRLRLGPNGWDRAEGIE